MLTLLDRPETNGLCLVRRVKWSPNGKHLAAILFQRVGGEASSTILLWNLSKSTSAESLGTFPTPIMSIAFTGDGRFLAAGLDIETIRIWDLSEMTLKRTFLLGELGDGSETEPSPEIQQYYAGISYVCNFANNHSLASFWGGRWALWDLRDPDRPIDVQRSQNYSVDTCASSADGSVLVFVDKAGVARRFKASTGLKRPAKLWASKGCERIAISRCGSRFALIDKSQIQFGKVGGPNRELACLVGHVGFIYTAIFGPDHRTMLTGGHDGTTRLWDLDRQKELAQYDWGIGRVTAMDLSPDGNSVVVGGDGQQNLVIWDFE